MATDKQSVCRIAAAQTNKGIPEIYDAMGECIEPECGDTLQIYIHIKNQIIVDIGYTLTADACIPMHACASIITVLAKSKIPLIAYQLSAKEIAKEMTTDGMLDKEHQHCAIMAELALKRAIFAYSQSLNQLNFS